MPSDTSTAPKARSRLLLHGGTAAGKHREGIRSAASRHKAEAISLIGSVARGDDTQDSDFDFLADFAPGASLLDQAGLIRDLRELLGCHVDVISSGALTDADSGIRGEAILL